MPKTKTEFESAEAFKVEGGYLFPFTLMDDTPGGSNLGRIMWNIEIHKTQKQDGVNYITQMVVWANQTRDPRYQDKNFLLECHTAGIMTCGLTSKDDLMPHVWFVAVCAEHGKTVLRAYPSNGHAALQVEAYSSVGTRIHFLTEQELIKREGGNGTIH